MLNYCSSTAIMSIFHCSSYNTLLSTSLILTAIFLSQATNLSPSEAFQSCQMFEKPSFSLFTHCNSTLFNNELSNQTVGQLQSFSIGPTNRFYFQDENHWIHQRLSCDFLSNPETKMKHTKFCLSHFFNGYTIGYTLVLRESACNAHGKGPGTTHHHTRYHIKDLSVGSLGIKQTLINFAGFTRNYTDFHLLRPTECQENYPNRKWYKNPSMVLANVVLILQTFAAVTATLYDFFLHDKDDPYDYLAAHNIFLCWSLKKNFMKIFNLPKGIDTLRPLLGLKAVAMFWFFVGRSHVLAMPFVENLDEYTTAITGPWYMQIIMNYTLAVDVFYLSSGILTSYNFFTERRIVLEEAVEDEQHSVVKDIVTFFQELYRHRFIRLWPTMVWIFLIIIGGQAMYPNHPLFAILDPWNECSSTFWVNWLLLNTIFPTRCLRYTWYLANDFIYYVTSPLILLGLYTRPFWGISFAVFLTGCSLAVTLVVNWFYKFPPSVFPMKESKIFPETFYELETQIFIRPFTHYGPYLIGMIVGYFLAKPRSDDPFVKLAQAHQKHHGYHFIWIGSVLGFFWALFGSYPAIKDLDLQLYYMIYSTFSQVVLVLSISWFLYACHIEEAKWLNTCLGCGGWLPFANQEYPCFIVHYLTINAVYYWAADFPIVWQGPGTLVPYILIQLILTLLISTPVYFFISIPPFSIEKICLDKKPPPEELTYQATVVETDQSQLPDLPHGKWPEMAKSAVDAVAIPLCTTFSWLKRKVMYSKSLGFLYNVFCNFWGVVFGIILTAVLVTIFLNIS